MSNTNGILVYSRGAAMPSFALSSAAIAAIYGLAIDKAGNLFVSYVAPRGGDHFGAFPASISLGARYFVPDVALITAGKPPQMTVDANGDLLVTNLSLTAGGGVVLGVFGPAVKSAAFGFSVGIGPVPFKLIALTTDDANLIVGLVSSGQLLRYGYPSGRLEAAIQLPVSVISGMAVSGSAPAGTW